MKWAENLWFSIPYIHEDCPKISAISVESEKNDNKFSFVIDKSNTLYILGEYNMTTSVT